MIQNFFGKCKDFFIESVNKLKGSERRIILAKLAKEIGRGGQTVVAKEFNASRDTIRKGKYELESGIKIIDAFNARGRKKIEDKLTSLLTDIIDIVDSGSQTDPNFKSTRLFTRLTVKEVKNQLIVKKKYKENVLPTNTTLNTKINQLGYQLKKVKKVKPLKKIKEADDIFENLKNLHDENKNKNNVIRISIDAKNKVNIGNFSRGGYSRIITKAYDHDFCNDYITPFGILDITNEKVHFSFTKSKVTSDFIVDAIESYWIENVDKNKVDTLIINSDNGPENNSRRTQFIKRIIEFSIKYNVKVILAYYPPYHSKYNPVERVWGLLEKHWNGSILNNVEAILGFAKSMTWKGKNPFVKIIEGIYETGQKVGKDLMKKYEYMLERKKGIEKWFIKINPKKIKGLFDELINN